MYKHDDPTMSRSINFKASTFKHRIISLVNVKSLHTESIWTELIGTALVIRKDTGIME